jgi:hypothetical protein
MLAGVVVAVAAYCLAGLCGRLREDILRTGDCLTATLTGQSKEHLTVQLDDGRRVGLYGYGPDLRDGSPLPVCVSTGGTWADSNGDSSNWLLTVEPSLFPAAGAGMLVILALYAGDGVRIGRHDEE